MTSAQEKAITEAGCEVRFDNLTRQLYATDASIYQIEPAGAAFPRSAKEASAIINAAAQENISAPPRGAGTSLVGNAVGEGLIVDFSRHNRKIDNLNIDNRSVRVGAGVVLDQLNAFLKPHGFCFGPDVATSSRATIGGMIANNSSGARVPVYGTTADHVLSTEIVLADGRIVEVGPKHESLRDERNAIDNLVRANAAEMAERWPPGLLKRWPGYGIERFSRAPKNLNEILAGSEGTLAAIFSVELKISPLPREKGLGLIFFASVADAMQATVALLDLKPAAIGLLHVRPVLDLHSADDLRKFRLVADQTSALVRQFKGSLSAEHGVGIARTEYMRDQLGDALLNVMREIKRTFDPKNIFNPGKIFGFAHKIDNHLRNNFTRPIELPFEPRLAFAFKDRSFIGNLEQCNGCGGCRKDAPIMCPTFIATGDEVMSTRGRANIIRRSLELRSSGHDPLKSAELEAALSNCLSCKGCTPECPSNVKLALLKAEMLYARHKRDGLPLRERFFSNVDLLGRIGCTIPWLANATLDHAPIRALMEKTLGISAKRSLPHYTHNRFDRWFERRRMEGHAPSGQRRDRARPANGKVILWDDTFIRYHEPNIGIAAVKVLNALGFEVELLQNRKCCGRPAFSQGNLDAAAEAGQHNVDLLMTPQHLNSSTPQPPVVFLEPSCWSMFMEDYRELKIPNAEKIAARCFLFEKFIDDLLEQS